MTTPTPRAEAELHAAVRRAYHLTPSRLAQLGSIASLNVGHTERGQTWRPDAMGVRDALASIVGPLAAGPIIELGAGLGANLDNATAAFTTTSPATAVHCVAIDLVEALVRTGVRRPGAHHLGAVGDTQHAPCRTASAALVMAIETLHYCADVVAASCEMRRVCITGGWVAIAGIGVGSEPADFARFLAAEDGLGLTDFRSRDITEGVLRAARQRREWVADSSRGSHDPRLVAAMRSFDATNATVFTAMERGLMSYWTWAGRAPAAAQPVADSWRHVLGVPARRLRRQTRNLLERSLLDTQD